MACQFTAGHAVKPEIVDSLLTVYEHTPDNNKYVIARQITGICLEGDILAKVPAADKFDGQSADSLSLLVCFAVERYYYNNSYFAESLRYIEQALPLAVGNDADIYATLLCDRCYCLFKQGRMTEAAQAGQLAMQYCQERSLKPHLARSYLYLAIVNYGLPQIEQAKLLVQKAIDVDAQVGPNKNTHNILGIACEIYSQGGEPDKAIAYGQRAVEEARAIGYEEGVVNHLSQLSYAYNRKGDYQRGLDVARQAVETVEQMEVPDRNLLAISLEYVAFNLLDMKRNAEAVPVLLKAISLEQQVGNTRAVCNGYRSLAEAYEPDEPLKAVAALRKYCVMSDSIHNAELNEALSKADAEFHNQMLQDENSYHQRQNRLIIIAAFALTLLLLTVIAFIMYAYRMRGKINRNLQQQQQSQEMFFNHVTHEFRTPLTVILGLSRQLRQPDRQHDQAELAHSAGLIEQEGNRLLQLVNQLLDVARMKTSIGTPRWQRGNMVPLLSMFTESLQQLAASRQLTLTYQPHVTVSEGLTAEEQTDFVSDYVQKIVVNLLTNAIKHTQEGGVVTMQSRCADGRFVLTVSDNGMGIAPEDLPHIFEPFYMGRNASSEQSTGIGLTLTKQLVEAMHGTISVESVLGKGTTFTVSIPQRQQGITVDDVSTIAPAFDESASGVSVVLTDSSLNAEEDNIRVLVVEDNREVAFYIGSLLAPRYDVFYATDGEMGIEKASRLLPDIVITDVMMPRMNGLEFCRHIRSNELTCHIPVIVVTAMVSEKDRLEGLRAGATAYLNKPFNEEELLTLVGNLLHQQKEMQKQLMKMIENNGLQPDNTLQEKENLTEENTSEELAMSSEHQLCEYDQRFLAKLRELVVENMEQGNISAEQLAPLMAMSQSQLRRKIIAVTGVSAAKYITLLRINEAKELLKQYPEQTIIETAYRTGFADNAHFTKVFHRYTGITPMQYIKKVGKLQ